MIQILNLTNIFWCNDWWKVRFTGIVGNVKIKVGTDENRLFC